MEINLIKLKKNFKSITSVTLLVALVLLPVITLIVGSINLDTSNFKYLWDYLLIDYSFDTIYLLFLTLLFSLLLGILPAWFISVNKFRGRKIYDLLLYLPLAIPTYIMSFSYAEILSFSGPFQNLVRDYFPNYSDIVNRDYLQIEVLALLLSFSLFPYLYAACRISFSMIGKNYINLSKNLGLNEIKTFLKVGIPLSRPSIFSAIFLISMEVLNEYGAVSYFGVNTYTSGIFRAWGSLADINTASLLSVFLFFVVFVFFLTEKFFTNKYKYDVKVNSSSDHKFHNTNFKLLLIHIVCLVIIFFSLIVPIIFMINNAFIVSDNIDFDNLILLTKNTILVSLISTILIVIAVLGIQFLSRVSSVKFLRFTSNLISLSYALPGAVIGISLILLFSPINDFFGFLIIGSFPVLIYAYFIRYMAVAVSPISSSFEKLSTKLDDTGKNLGLNPFKYFSKIFIPLNKKAIIIAFCISFVDIMKDLPLTLILRPFNFDTLATKTYELAVEEMITESAIYSLAIISFGFILLSVLNLTQSKS